MTCRRNAVALAIAGLVAWGGSVGAQAPGPSPPTPAPPGPQGQPPQEPALQGPRPLEGDADGAFRKKLQAFAATKSAVGDAKYWAIIRRGLDAADEVKASNGSLDSIVLDNLNSEPGRADLEPMGQSNTRLRLGPDVGKNLRIIKGFPIVDDSVQEVVALEGHNHICSGIALDPQHVLTAAHCVGDLQLARGGEPKIVVVGNDTRAANRQLFTVVPDQTRVFGGFACVGQVTPPCHDLALITIGGAMPMPSVVFGTPSLLAGELPRRKPDDPPFQIFGFGCSVTPTAFDADGHPLCPSSKMDVKRTQFLYKSAGCAAGIPPGCQTGEFELDDNVSDACIGDSGGPVILSPKPDDGIGFRLVGIISRSIRPGCGPGIGGIYTSTTTLEVITWLRDNGVTVTQK